MTAKEIQKKLESMKGKAFEYAKATHIVKSYVVEEETFTVKTDKSSFRRKIESAKEFFKYWFESPQTMAIEKAQVHQGGADDLTALPAVMQKEEDLAAELTDILRDNIRKVQKDPAYIKQATAVTNNVNSILNIQKLKIQYITAQMKRKKLEE